jgi:DNA-directed RNA polymerase specialized sigma24 family protein
MSNNRNHGGKRERAGRKPVDLDLVMKVGRAFRDFQKREINKKWRSLIEEKTNIDEYHRLINEIPVNERKAFLQSSDYLEHSTAMDAELKAFGQPINSDRKPSRLVAAARLYGCNEQIRKEVAEAFGISEVQVKNYVQKYRRIFERT